MRVQCTTACHTSCRKTTSSLQHVQTTPLSRRKGAYVSTGATIQDRLPSIDQYPTCQQPATETSSIHCWFTIKSVENRALRYNQECPAGCCLPCFTGLLYWANPPSTNSATTPRYRARFSYSHNAPRPYNWVLISMQPQGTQPQDWQSPQPAGCWAAVGQSAQDESHRMALNFPAAHGAAWLAFGAGSLHLQVHKTVVTQHHVVAWEQRHAAPCIQAHHAVKVWQAGARVLLLVLLGAGRFGANTSLLRAAGGCCSSSSTTICCSPVLVSHVLAPFCQQGCLHQTCK